VEKFLRLSFNRLGIIFIISVVFLSIPQQKFLFKYNFSVICSESITATYPNLTFSTYLGGEDGAEYAGGIAIAPDGSYYISGQTASTDFPTQHAYNNTTSGNRDVTITKFRSNNSLLWSTYFGGSDSEGSFDVALAGDSSCYITGYTRSSDFPLLNAYNSTYCGSDDAFLSKFAANGSLLWSTYLGGSDQDSGYSIAVAADGSCYVTGITMSSDFPTKNAFESTYNGGNFDAFIAKFSSNGSLIWSSFLGGDRIDVGYGLAVTSDSSCYITGLTASLDFPTKNAYDTIPNGYWDVFVTKFHPNGSLSWSTLLGGSAYEEGLGIDAGSDGSCYVTGQTTSPNFPTQHAFNSTYGNWEEAFVTKFAANGSLLWSTYLGGNDVDSGYDVVVTSNGSCFVTGRTGSDNFPIKNAYDEIRKLAFDAFVTKFSSDGFLLWSTFLGGNDTDEGHGISIGSDGSCYVMGKTWSADFPTQNAYDNTLGATSDIFIVKFVDTPLPSTSHRAYYGFLVFIIIIPIIVFIFSKKRK
jgi:hypothetical protein